MSSRASNTTEVAKWTSQAQLAAQFGMGDGSCPFPHNGWELSADKACGGMVNVAGVAGIQVQGTSAVESAGFMECGLQMAGRQVGWQPAGSPLSAKGRWLHPAASPEGACMRC